MGDVYGPVWCPIMFTEKKMSSVAHSDSAHNQRLLSRYNPVSFMATPPLPKLTVAVDNYGIVRSRLQFLW